MFVWLRASEFTYTSFHICNYETIYMNIQLHLKKNVINIILIMPLSVYNFESEGLMVVKFYLRETFWK